MKAITLYYSANQRGNPQNKKYSSMLYVNSPDVLRRAVERDHVTARYRNDYRSKENFMEADCLSMDCDNTHSDDPAAWKYPHHVQQAFPGAAFWVCYSRNHMRPKDGKTARPKFHVYFPIERVTDPKAYAGMKQAARAVFPEFDAAAVDAARFFFGVDGPKVEYMEGEKLLSDILQVIPQGQRNDTMHREAVRLLKRHGDTPQARQEYDAQAARCVPPMDGQELERAWQSALRFFHGTVEPSPGYVPPGEFSAAPGLHPADYSDVGQAAVLAKEHGDRLRYSEATGWLCYSGAVWEESAIKAQGLAQELTGRQLAQARQGCAAALGDKEAEKAAKEYFAHVMRHRESHKVAAALTAARPALEIAVDALDADGFKLNTPGGTVDLMSGAIRPHDPKDYCTRITAVAPGELGADLWADFLRVVTCGDRDLAGYLQIIAGQAAIGKVFVENLVIAHGGGHNGKSTLFNVLAKVLGGYSGSLSAETLTTNCRKNKSPEYAELRGKRLVIAAELEEGQRLDTAIVKKLCSTDRIQAEKKYKDPFSFEPSHTTVLYTNHLPKVGTTDAGTWRRLQVIPFNAKIEGGGEIKNYAEYLFEHAGPAILQWVIDGAARFIRAGYKVEPPQAVRAAVEQYREANDWLQIFIDEKCETGPGLSANSGTLYGIYKKHCEDTGAHRRGTSDFKAALEGAGYRFQKTKACNKFFGLRTIEADYLS